MASSLQMPSASTAGELHQFTSWRTLQFEEPAPASNAADTRATALRDLFVSANRKLLADPAKNTIELPGAVLTLFEKRIQGSLFGSGDPFHDIPRMVELYQAGDLKLDELITSTYTLDQINQGYQDLLDGKNIRGVILYSPA